MNHTSAGLERFCSSAGRPAHFVTDKTLLLSGVGERAQPPMLQRWIRGARSGPASRLTESIATRTRSPRWPFISCDHRSSTSTASTSTDPPQFPPHIICFLWQMPGGARRNKIAAPPPKWKRKRRRVQSPEVIEIDVIEILSDDGALPLPKKHHTTAGASSSISPISEEVQKLRKVRSVICFLHIY
jgi:hypothetical protein